MHKLDYTKWHWTNDASRTVCGRAIPVGLDGTFLPETDERLTEVTCAICLGNVIFGKNVPSGRRGRGRNVMSRGLCDNHWIGRAYVSVASQYARRAKNWQTARWIKVRFRVRADERRHRREASAR
jgi:hypothetical protein